MPTQNQLMLKALEAIKANDHLKAAEYLEDLLREDPQNDEAWVMAAKLFKDPEKRLEYAQKALEVDPNNNEAAWLVKTLPAEVAIHHRRQSIFIFLDGILIVGIALVMMTGLLWLGGVLQARPEPIRVAAEDAPLETNSQKTLTAHKLTSQNAIPVSPNAPNSNISASPDISHDNQFVAFTTYRNQIYTFELTKRRSSLVTANADREPADGASSNPSISADSRFVAFESTSKNMRVVGYPNGIGGDERVNNVYLFDRLAGEIHLVSKTFDGQPIQAAASTSLAPVISDDGVYVAYHSNESNIVPNDTNRRSDIFLYNRETDTTIRVSVSSDGTEANGASMNPDISGNGQFIVFASLATNLDSNLSRGKRQIFVHNQNAKSTKIINRESEHADNPKISADGQTIAYTKLVSSSRHRREEGQPPTDIVVWDNRNGETEVVSDVLGSLRNLTAGSLEDTHVSISADGRYVVFGQSSNHLQTNNPDTKIRDAFVYDRQAEAIHQFKSEGNIRGDDGLYDPSISADGQWLVFVTQDRELTFSYNGFTVLMAPTGFRQTE